ncbi:MAG TPA: SH3 domain-containing protein [Hyphomicrobiaceae bacterium]|nr:SH3 domain-containing protein [Hyphomicrobiaceae bacterium]
MTPEDALRGLKSLTERVAKDGVAREPAARAGQSRAVARRDELAADARTPLYDHLMAMVQATAEENEYVTQAPDVGGTPRAGNRKLRVNTVVHFVAGVIVAVAVGRAIFVWVTRPSQAPAVVAAADSARSEDRVPAVPATPAPAAPTETAPIQTAPTQTAPTQTASTQAAPTQAAPDEATHSGDALAEAVPAHAPPTQATSTEATPPEAAAPATHFSPAAAPSSPAPIAADGEQTTAAEADAEPVVAAASPVEPARAAPDEPAEAAQPASAPTPPSAAPDDSAVVPAPEDTAALAEPESTAQATNLAGEPPPAEEASRTKPPAIQTGSIERDGAAADAPPVATRPAWIVSDVNMRAGPKKSEPVLVAIPKGRPVELIGCRTWCEVIYAGKRGWVYKNYIGETPGPGGT